MEGGSGSWNRRTSRIVLKDKSGRLLGRGESSSRTSRTVCKKMVCSLGVLCVLHGDLQLLLRQDLAPMQYNKVYLWTKIYLPEGQSYLRVLFHKMKWSFSW